MSCIGAVDGAALTLACGQLRAGGGNDLLDYSSHQSSRH